MSKNSNFIDLKSEETWSLLDYEGGQENDGQKSEIKQYEEINYSFMDGLRGFGSFAVYMSHIHDQFYPFRTQEEIDDGKDQRHFPDWMR